MYMFFSMEHVQLLFPLSVPFVASPSPFFDSHSPIYPAPQRTRPTATGRHQATETANKKNEKVEEQNSSIMEGPRLYVDFSLQRCFR